MVRNDHCRRRYPDLDGLRQHAREAENCPGDRESFRQLNLNIWLDHSADPFVAMSTTTDLTAVVACVLDEDENRHIVLHFFVPADNLRGRAERDGAPYPLWAEQGFITATPGNVIDYRAVEHGIRGLCDRFDVREINFDPAYAQPVMGPLTDDGFPVFTLRQG